MAFWAFILAFWGFISFHFGLLGLHFLPFILAFWAFILAFCAFISLHFGLLGLHFLSFWPLRLLFPCILAFWGFILAFCLPFSLLKLQGGYPLHLRGFARGVHPTSCQKRSVFPLSHIKNLAAPGPPSFSKFLPFGPSFPFILAFWAFISFHFGILGFSFLSFWPFAASFPFILAFWAFISLHFGLLGLHFLSFLRLLFPCILGSWGFILAFCLPFGVLKLQGGYPLHLRGFARGVHPRKLPGLPLKFAFLHNGFS